MSVATFRFLFFLACVFLLYFITPNSKRWIVLLIGSIVFYAISSIKSMLFILVTTISVYYAALELEKLNLESQTAIQNAEKGKRKSIRAVYKKKKKRILALALIFNLGILGIMKYTGFILSIFGLALPSLGFFENSSGTGFLLPLGISFYTFQAAGYVIDVYYGKIRAERNLPKFALFISFFPSIIQGPISRFSQLSSQLYEGHRFDLHQLKRGSLLILWGYFKKLVVADRLYPAVWGVLDKYTKYSGTGIAIAMVFYCIELYADFSGGIDISRGFCETLGIELTPNFRQPFYARSLSEFWRRWNISLNDWVRDYIFYPIATGKPYNKLQKVIREHSNQALAEKVCVSLASFITFMVIGIWHGAAWAYVLYGLWYGGISAISNLLTGLYERFHQITHIPSASYGWKLFQRLRTLMIVLLSFYLLLPASPADSVAMFLKTITDFEFSRAAFIKVLTKLVFKKQFPVAAWGTIAIMIVGALSEHGRDIRKDLEALPTALEWSVILAGIMIVLIFGFYGPEYDGTSFIYQVF